MKWLLTLCLLLMVPGGQACSIAWSEFDTADKAGSKVLTTRGEDGVIIDLVTGHQTVVSGDFFPALGFAGSAPHVMHSGQEGLGADCSGRRYFEALDSSGKQVWERDGVEAFDADGGRFVYVSSTGLHVAKVGAWSNSDRIATISSADATFVALDDAGGRVAVTGPDGSVRVLNAGGGQQLQRFGGMEEWGWSGVLDWHRGQLVVMQGGNGGADAWIIQPATGERHHYRLVADAWGRPTIAAGSVLLLQFGDEVLRVSDGGSQRLRIPSPYEAGAVGGDPSGAVLLVTKDHQAAGILRFTASGSISTWYTQAEDGRWRASEAPGFSWQKGPDGEVSQDVPTVEQTPAPLAVPLLAVLVIAFLRRRTA